MTEIMTPPVNGMLQEQANAISNTVTRIASVDRTRSFAEAIIATGRMQYVNDNVVADAPKGEGHTEFVFVNIGRNVKTRKLDEELDKLGFELIVDPQGLASINEADPAFADKHPNGTQWKDADGNYCCAIFDLWDGKRGVLVARRLVYWADHWWFPCRYKKPVA